MRKLICLALLLLTATVARSQTAGRYSVTLMGMYGWNETWKHCGGTDILGYLPVNEHFEATAAMEYLSSRTFAATITARPKFPLPVGEIFLDGTAHYRNFAAYRISDFTLAASLGYRMDYISVQLGLTNHNILDKDRDRNSGSINVSEPFNLLVRIAFNVRPATSRWNVGAGAANYTDFEYERTWEPMFFINGHYDINDNFSVLMRSDLKPAGAFHLNAGFWGISLRAGVKYTF